MSVKFNSVVLTNIVTDTTERHDQPLHGYPDQMDNHIPVRSSDAHHVWINFIVLTGMCAFTNCQ